MNFVERVQKQPLTVLTLFTIVVVIGILMVSNLSVAMMPDISVPVVAVQTTYVGASPEEVEDEIIIPLEEGLTAISGLSSINSTAAENYGTIVLWFDYGVDTDKAKDDVENIVKQIQSSLPESSDDPQVIQYDPNSMAVMELTLYGDKSVDELGRLADKIVKPELERISGVAQVDIFGEREKEVHIDVLKNRMEAHKLSLQMIYRNVAQQNLELSAGTIPLNELDLILTSKGEYKSLEDIENTVIHRIVMGQSGESHEVLVRDVADVSLGWAEETSKVIIDGKEGISLSILSTDDANVVELSEEVQKAQKDINKRLPGDVKLKILGDSSQQVKDVLNEVINSAVIGVVFAVLILAIFLGRWNSTLIVALSIPVSIMMTIAGLAIAGKTFNMLTLGGLLLGVGMIVDGSIVILENIDKYRKKGILPKTAALIGTKEMVVPVIGSILTSICVFIPMFLMQEEMGLMGQMFGDLSLTVILALGSSLLVATVLVPVLSSMTSKDVLGARVKKRNPVSAFIDRIIHGLENIYKKALSLAVKRKWITILVVFSMLAASLTLVPSIGLEFSPPSSEDTVVLNVDLPAGTNLETTKELIDQLEQVVMEQIKGYDSVISTSGGRESYSGSLKIILPSINKQQESIDEIKAVLRTQFELYPQAQFSFASTDQMSRMSGGDADITIRLISQNLELVTKAADELIRLIRDRVSGISELTSSAAEGLPEIEIQIDRKKAFDLGLNTSGIAQELRGQITGFKATSYNNGEETLDVVVRLQESDRNSMADLENLFVQNSRGQKVAVSNFARLVRSETPATIKREDQSRSVKVEGILLPGFQANFVQQEVEIIISEEYELPEGVKIEYGGAMDRITESMSGMSLVLIVAILLVFGVMVSQFESLKAPFIIIIAMISMITGVILIFFITGVPFSMPSMLGIIMLAGIVVNNGIILVDYINLLKKRGLPVKDAIVEAGGSRLRPVLMTTLTTVLAMSPMAFFPGEGAEMLQALGLAVVGGLSFNTITTLFVVPALYAVFYKGKALKKGEK